MIARLFIFIIGISILTSDCLYAQDIPSCNASSITLTDNFLDISANSATAILRIDSIQDDIADYTLQHDFFPGMDATEFQNFPPALEMIEWTHPLTGGSHRFTLINNCLDGTAHTGASFSVNYFESDFNCPAITGLLINELTDDFINFSWDFLDEADRYRVTYLAGTNEFPFIDTFEPFFEQALVEDSILHTFKIKAVCEIPGVESSIEVFGPELEFSIITIDDIKLLQLCVNEIEEEILNTFRLICPDSTITVNKQAFMAKLKAHEPPGCMTALENHDELIDPFKVFPNPATDHLFIQMAFFPGDAYEILLYDQHGKVLLLDQLTSYSSDRLTERSLSLPSLPAGMYFVQIRSSSGIFTKKVILQ